MTTAHRHHDRTVSPRQTLARLRPHFSTLGITRLGELTGLDDLGIPVAFAVRPNSFSLALSLGKGVDREAAFTSAAMEAAETAIAERLPRGVRRASADDLTSAGHTAIDLDTMARCHSHRFAANDEVAWAAGRDLKTGATIYAPWALVGLDHRIAPDGFHDAFYVASDGLASGNSFEEAVFHGLCELVERDALTLLQFAGNDQLAKSEVKPTGQEHPHLPALLELIEKAGLRLRMFRLQSDIEIPAFMALFEARHRQNALAGMTATRCGGCGCHPLAGRAMLKAITEAAQARVALVAGARDDIRSQHYGTRAQSAGNVSANGPEDETCSTNAFTVSEHEARYEAHTISTHLTDLTECLGNAGVEQIIAIELDAGPADIHVVRVLAADLQVPLQGHRVQVTKRGRRLLEAAVA